MTKSATKSHLVPIYTFQSDTAGLTYIISPIMGSVILWLETNGMCNPPDYTANKMVSTQCSDFGKTRSIELFKMCDPPDYTIQEVLSYPKWIWFQDVWSSWLQYKMCNPPDYAVHRDRFKMCNPPDYAWDVQSCWLLIIPDETAKELPFWNFQIWKSENQP